MSADESGGLREAATEMRRVAENATPGRWKLWGMTVMADQDGTSNVDNAVEVAATVYRDENGKPRTWDASQIAGFDPTVGLAIADLLLMVADHAAGRGAVCGSCVDQANKVAAAYLGTAQNAATDAHDHPGATNSPEVAGSQAAHTDAHQAPDSLGVQDRAGLGEVGA